jgi:hypothetical protein
VGDDDDPNLPLQDVDTVLNVLLQGRLRVDFRLVQQDQIRLVEYLSYPRGHKPRVGSPHDWLPPDRGVPDQLANEHNHWSSCSTSTVMSSYT